MIDRTFALILFGMAFLLAGCTPTPPTCVDQQSTDLVKKILLKSIADSASQIGLEERSAQRIANSIQIAVMAIRTRSTDDKSKRVTCDAVLEITLPELAARSANEPTFRVALSSSFDIQNVEVSGRAIKTNIEYTSQLTDDTKQQYVESKGQASLVGALLVLNSMGNFDQKSISRSQTAPESTSNSSRSVSNTEQAQLVTKYGTLSVIGEWNAMQLLLNGNKLRDGDGASLSFHGKYSIKEEEIALVMNNSGGSACPSQYFFVILSSSGAAKLTPQFGTCSDLPEITQSGAQINIVMPSGSGTKATYILLDGKVSENGKVIR